MPEHVTVIMPANTIDKEQLKEQAEYYRQQDKHRFEGDKSMESERFYYGYSFAISDIIFYVNRLSR